MNLVGQLADMLIYAVFHVETYEQIAAHLLLSSLHSPLLFVTLLIQILLVAPLIEEYLFRGLLQTYVRKRLGRGKSILLTSLCFAAFHLAPSQGAGNIPLFLSLFTFSLFLCFLYEKQASLRASITLHFTFNLLNVFLLLTRQS